MKSLLIYLIAIFTLFFSELKAQEKTTNIEQFIADIFEQYSAETEQELDFESFYDDLLQLSENPIELNSARKEQFAKLPFLSDIQIENILSYIYTNGPLNTIYELQLIDGLDMTDIRRMLPFVTIEKIEKKSPKIYKVDLLKYGKNQMLLRFDKGLEPKAGYLLSENKTKNYQGSSLYNSLKYEYRFKDRIRVGFTMEKDAGEQFMGNVNKGYDFYSFHAQINDIDHFKTIVVGDFRASFGQGLVLGSAFGMGKSSYVLKINTSGDGLKKFSSTNEVSFFRGFGTTMNYNKFDFTVFYSNKNIDADTVNGTFQSFYKTGLHRTNSEILKKATVNEQIAGCNATYTNNNVQIGLTLVHTAFNYQLKPDKTLYNYFYLSGSQQTNAGLNYRFRLLKFNLFGETAISEKFSLATVNGLSFSPLSQVSLVVLQRYFSPRYDTFYANTFSESTRVNNESGVYLGAEIRPFKKWKIAAYADSYRFPWPKFGVDLPSMGDDYLLQVDFAPRRDLSMFWRCRYEKKQLNESSTEATLAQIVPVEKASFRYQLNYFYKGFNFRNIIEGKLSQKNYSGWSYGITSLQDLSYSFAKIPLSIDLRYQFFDAVDYDNRFYTYEKDILYAFSIPMYYGVGSRYYFNVKYDLNNHFSAWFKYAQTVYADDRETISAGNEEIIGNRKTDIRFMLRWEF